MTVGELQARLNHYPRETKVLILLEGSREGIAIQQTIVSTFIRPDTESQPSSIMLQPQYPLTKVQKAE